VRSSTGFRHAVRPQLHLADVGGTRGWTPSPSPSPSPVLIVVRSASPAVRGSDWPTDGPTGPTQPSLFFDVTSGSNDIAGSAGSRPRSVMTSPPAATCRTGRPFRPSCRRRDDETFNERSSERPAPPATDHGGVRDGALPCAARAFSAERGEAGDRAFRLAGWWSWALAAKT